MKYFSQFVFFVLALYLFAPGNVARALTRTKKLNNATATVISHNNNWVYNKLLRNLPYSETKKYLKDVTERANIYERWM